MFIRYIYIDKYENIIENQDINFKWKYKFKFNKGNIDLNINNDYIHDFYNNYSNLEDITAIIGKNTSGKSSILRAMNIVFSQIHGGIYNSEESHKIKFIAIFSKGDKIYCYHNMGLEIKVITKFKIEENIEIFNITVENKIKECHKTKYVYYSSIFDKNDAFRECNDFIDISSNNLLRKSIEGTYYLKRERWRRLSKHNDSELEADYSTRMERETGQFDFVDEFRKKEMLRQMNFYIEAKKRKLVDKDKLLFKFPDKVYISYADNFNIKDEFKSDLSNKEEVEIIDAFTEVIEEYTLYFNGDFYDMNSKEENLIIQFALLIYYELIEYLYRVLDKDIFWNIDEFLTYINEEGINIKNIKNYIGKLKNEKILVEANSILDNISQNEEKEEKVTLINKIQDIMNVLDYEDTGNYIECDYLDEYKCKYTTKEKISFILDCIEDMLSHVEELFINRDQLIDDRQKFDILKGISINNIYEEQVKDISIIEQIVNSFRDIIPKESDENSYENILYKDLLYEDGDDKNEQLLQFYDELKEELNSIYEFVKYDSNQGYLNEDILKNVEYKSVYLESSEEAINHVNLTMDIISQWERLVKTNNVISYKDSELVLEARWENDDIFKFIDLYNNYKVNSFQIEYESESMSSGQIVYFEMQHRIYDVINSLDELDIILMIDEADIYASRGAD